MKETLENRVSADRLNRTVSQLARYGALGETIESGVTRIAFSDEETRALQYIEAEAKEEGFDTRYDGIGNLYVTFGPVENGVIQIGSHIDSVYEGGVFDGALGILTGLESMRAISSAGIALRYGIELACWRGEEHTYDAVYKGSATAFGVSDPKILRHRGREGTLAEAIVSQGLDPSPIEDGRATLSQREIDRIQAHLELHIEQDDKLEKAGLDIGIVNAVSGHRRLLILVEGRFDHSGATDLGVENRSDANLAIAHMQVRLDQLAGVYRLSRRDFVQTVGVVNCDPKLNEEYPQVLQNAVTKVSGFGYFTFDMMSPSNGFMDEYTKAVKELVQRVAAEFAVQARVIDVDYSDALEQYPLGIQRAFEDGCREFGYRYQYMPSGAGHDSALIGVQKNSRGEPIPVGLIFVPCRQGISHSPIEYVSQDQMLKGALVLTHAAASLARERE